MQFYTWLSNNFSKPTSKNGGKGPSLSLESFLANPENHLQCTAEFLSKAYKDLFF